MHRTSAEWADNYWEGAVGALPWHPAVSGVEPILISDVDMKASTPSDVPSTYYSRSVLVINLSADLGFRRAMLRDLCSVLDRNEVRDG